MLLHLNPRWAPSSGSKKRLEEQASLGSRGGALVHPVSLAYFVKLFQLHRSSQLCLQHVVKQCQGLIQQV